MNARRGSLVVVGTGIKVASQTSAEAIASIEGAEKVYYLAADALTQRWVTLLNPTAEPLHGRYAVGKNRARTYEEIVTCVLGSVREGKRVCLAVYGHPGVFAYPTHEAVRRARSEGFEAVMFPAVSAEDCLFADLGVDPGASGCQSFEATDFLIHTRVFDPRSTLILWQIGAVGVATVRDGSAAWSRDGLIVLADVLTRHYPPDHLVTIYDAAVYAMCDPRIVRVPLAQLAHGAVSAISTLYVPPLGPASPDVAMLRRLGLAGASFEDEQEKKRAVGS